MIARFVRRTAALLALSCVACMSVPTEMASSEPRPEPVYRTGSKIPVRDPDSVYSKSIEPQMVRDQMMHRGGQGATRPKGE
jgi:hypothetical protein